jgi:hypothetical protein
VLEKIWRIYIGGGVASIIKKVLELAVRGAKNASREIIAP